MFPPTSTPRLRLAEDFASLPPLGSGDLSHFARGYAGWRYNVEAIGGHWHVEDGSFVGREIPEHGHPATASFGFPHRNILLRCSFRLDAIGAAGLPWRTFMVRFTNATGYVATLKADPGHVLLEKCRNVASGSEERQELARWPSPSELGVWRELELSLTGEECTAALDGQPPVRVAHPFFDQDRTTVLFGTQTGASIRRLRIWDV